MEQSLAQLFASLPKDKQALLLDKLSAESISDLMHCWEFLARPKQKPPPGNWRIWLVLAGRGFGKTRTGAEWVRSRVESGQAKRIALVGRTSADVRDVMVDGPAGLVTIAPPGMRPVYEPSKRRLVWPNGAVAQMFSADEPNLLRGPQFDCAWLDELAAWRYDDAFDQLMFGLRLGKDPRCIVTTTPKPTSRIRELTRQKTTHVTRGTTFENRANLAPQFFDEIVSRYEGTSIGRQELYADVLDEAPGALWTRETLDKHRVQRCPPLVRVVVAIDPAVSTKKNETGIIVVGVGEDRHAYILEDCSRKATPDQWARRAVIAYREHAADRIVAEVNQGGDLVEKLIRTIDEKISYRAVRASKGKHARAEPIAALYEQGKVHHVGAFPGLEDQMCSFVPGESIESPDRMDALVWGLTDTLLGKSALRGIRLGDFGLRASPWRI